MAGIYEVREENGELFAGEPCASVRVTSLHVEASTNYLVTEIKLSQEFKATEESTEVVYRLPIDEHAAVYEFSVQIGAGRPYIGEIRSKTEAMRIYKEQRARGHGRYMVREDAADMFEILLGRVVKGAPLKVSVTFVTQLSIRAVYDENGIDRPALRWVLPMTANLSGDHRGAEVRGRIDFTMPSRILTVQSSLEGGFSHKREGENRATAQLRGNVMLEKDMEVDVLLDDPPAACVVLESHPEHAPVASVMMLPWDWVDDGSTELDDASAEFVFVVHMPEAQQLTVDWMRMALEHGLRVVRERRSRSPCNIVLVGNEVQILNEQSVPNDEMWTVDQTAFIEQHLNMESAGRGGGLRGALEMVFQMQMPDGVAHRQVVLLSNGGVERPGNFLQQVRQERGSTRFFSMGFGSDPKLHQLLLRGVARNGCGTAYFVSRKDRIRHDMNCLIRDASEPAWTNVRIEWQPPQGEAAAGQEEPRCTGMARQGPPPQEAVPRLEDFAFVQTPFHAPPLLPGASFVSYTLLPQAGEGRAGPVPETCTMFWRKTGQQQDQSLDLPVQDWSEGLKMHRLAIKSFIRDLEEGRSVLHSTRRGLTPLQTEREIARCAQQFSLVSSETAFIARNDLSEHLQVSSPGYP